MTLTARIRAILAKAEQQFDLWGNLAPQSNPNLKPKRTLATRDGKTYMTTVYVRKDTGEQVDAPALPTPEPSPNPVVPVAAEPPEIPEPPAEPEPASEAAPENEEPGDFDDAGEHIAGSRKELAALRGDLKTRSLTLADLDTIDDAEDRSGVLLVTKSAIAGPDTIKNLRSLGLSAGAAYLFTKLWASIPAKPKETDKRSLRLYTMGVQRVLNIIQPGGNATTLEGMQQAIAGLSDTFFGKFVPHDKQMEHTLVKVAHELAKKGYFEVLAKVRAEPGSDYYAAGNDPRVIQAKREWRAAEQVLEEFYEANQPDDGEYRMRDAFDSFGTAFTNILGVSTGRDPYRAIDRRAKLRREAKRVDQADDWAWYESGGKSGGGKSTRPKWERTGPDEVIRVGGELRTFNNEALLDTFGIRGVQYGNYMDEESSREHTQRAGEALLDLADILGIDPKQVSLNGRLAIAFGARGTGRALAHYEPGQKVINLTKANGGGSLAHEWGHFLDHIVGMLHLRSDLDFITDKMFQAGPKVFAAPAEPSTPLPDEVLTAFRDLYRAMYQGSTVGTRTVKSKPDGKTHYRPWPPGERLMRAVGGDPHKAMQAAVDAVKPRLESTWGHQGALTDLRRYARYYSNNYQVELEYTIPEAPTSAASEYYKSAEKLGAYWKRPVEMFARAFETYVQDSLEATGRRNSYLVSGIAKDDVAKWQRENPGAVQEGARSPYPTGAERDSINTAMRKLIDALKAHDMFAKAMAMLGQS